MSEMSRHVVAEWVRAQRTASPVTKLVLQLIFDHAGPQEDGRWVAWVGNRTLAWEACFADGQSGMRTVRKHLADLEAAGIVEREERTRGNGSQTTSRVVLLIPADWADRGGRIDQTGGGGSAGPTLKPQGEAPVGSPKAAGPRTREVEIAHKLPEDLPAHLRDDATTAARILYRAATARGQKRAVMLEAVGRAVESNPTKDHVYIAGRVEHWLCWGRGQSTACKDIVGRFRDWLPDSPDVRLPDGSPLTEPGVALPVAGNVHALRPPGTNSSGDLHRVINAGLAAAQGTIEGTARDVG